MSRLKEIYKKEIVPKMKEIFGYKNDLVVPKLEKISINIGLGEAFKKKDPKIIETAKQTCFKITGQKPVETKVRKSIAGFKIRKNQVVGLKLTLRHEKMYDFLDKLINVVLPRTRDFKGIPLTAVDQQGNLSLGFREQLVFPEILPESVEKLHGLEVTIVTTARQREEGLTLLKLFGLPFKESL
ncbi:MAG: 50S ribosomal protein L5 [Patescibacteria group bacterium]|nr:50S ribosomal protein L5 [Patescibacteria group bacterium]